MISNFCAICNCSQPEPTFPEAKEIIRIIRIIIMLYQLQHFSLVLFSIVEGVLEGIGKKIVSKTTI